MPAQPSTTMKMALSDLPSGQTGMAYALMKPENMRFFFSKTGLYNPNRAMAVRTYLNYQPLEHMYLTGVQVSLITEHINDF